MLSLAAFFLGIRLILYYVFLSKTKLPAVKIGQKWRMLHRATAFNSMNILDSVEHSVLYQHMNYESHWWMLMDFMRLMLFVFRGPFPEVQQCTYNITQKDWLCIWCWTDLCSLMGLFTVVCRGISSVNCLFMQPWNQRISTTRNWEGNAQQGF